MPIDDPRGGVFYPKQTHYGFFYYVCVFVCRCLLSLGWSVIDEIPSYFCLFYSKEY